MMPSGTVPLWFVTLLGALILLLGSYLSPDGFSRLTRLRFWVLVGGTTLATGLLFLFLGIKSDDLALMINIGFLAVESAFACSFLLGLYMPLSRPVWYYAVAATCVTLLAILLALWTK